MQWIMVATPPFKSIDKVDEVLSHIPARPAGLEARYVGTADDGRLRVITVWESKADADRFVADDLGPALARVLAPEPVGAPTHIGIAVERVYNRELVG